MATTKICNLYLIRHGQTDFNKQQKFQGRGIDAPLNARGKAQARAIARDFQERGIVLDYMFCSSLKRTMETAEPLAIQQSLRVEAAGELDEMDFGQLEGTYVKDHGPLLEELQREWSSGNVQHSVPGGEHPEEVYARANAFVRGVLSKVFAASSHRTMKPLEIAFFIHGRLLRILLSEWLGLGLANMHKIEHTNGAINHIETDGHHFKAIECNRTLHLIDS
jgi:broad specificity phosphatase PhoE